MNDNKSLKELYSTMIAGVLSGSLSRIPLHPIDTIKTRLQASTSLVPTALAAEALSIIRNEGIRALYRGFSIAIVAGAPASCTYFTTYEITKSAMISRINKSSVFTESIIHLSAGFVAEAASCILWVPIDVVKVRMQVQKEGKRMKIYTNAIDAIKKIVHNEGNYGLYRGYGATLATFGPFSGLHFAFYEKLKSLALESSSSSSSFSLSILSSSSSSSLSSLSLIVCASGAAAAASLLTSPLDLIRLRMQVAKEVENNDNNEHNQGPRNKINYKGVFNGLSTIGQEEGLRGLFRGAFARVAFITPSTALAMVIFERSRDIINSYLN
jgi:hypothetical protein